VILQGDKATECDVSEYDLETSIMRKPTLTRDVES
jgi:hypothetical protein